MKRIYLAAAAGVLALLCMSPASMRAAIMDAPITFTVNQPVAIENTVLVPGTYIVKPIETNTARGVAMIFDKTGQHRIATSSFNNIERRSGDADTSGFSLYEAPAGSTPALRDVFATGEDLGIEFPAPR